MEINIDPEFRDLLPKLDEKTRDILARNIGDAGRCDPLTVWGNILIDGHNRLDICTKQHIAYETVSAPSWVETRADAIKWIIDNARGRRNMTKDQFDIVMGKYYNHSRKEEGGYHGNQYTEEALGKNYPEALRTSEKIAREMGVSEKTVRNAAKKADLFESLPKEKQNAIMAGKEKLPKEEKPKAKKDAIEDEMIIETLRGVAREIEDSLDLLDAATKGKIKTICMRIVEKV